MRRPQPLPGWYVQAAGKVWGPFPQDRLAGFVAEGRVSADTLMSPAAAGPFLPAGRQSALASLFGAAADPAAEPEARPAPARPLLVWARLGGLGEAEFEAALLQHGPCERVSAGLWLVRARMGAAGLRNALTRRLGASDELVVAEAALGATAWFNLDPARERALRHLWGGADG